MGQSDGRHIYVDTGIDLVVIDAASNTVIGAVRIDADKPPIASSSLAVAADGTVYLTTRDSVIAVDIDTPIERPL